MHTISYHSQRNAMEAEVDEVVADAGLSEVTSGELQHASLTRLLGVKFPGPFFLPGIVPKTHIFDAQLRGGGSEDPDRPGGKPAENRTLTDVYARRLRQKKG